MAALPIGRCRKQNRVDRRLRVAVNADRLSQGVFAEPADRDGGQAQRLGGEQDVLRGVA